MLLVSPGGRRAPARSRAVRAAAVASTTARGRTPPLSLEPGSLVVLYSDGLVERRGEPPATRPRAARTGRKGAWWPRRSAVSRSARSRARRRNVTPGRHSRPRRSARGESARRVPPSTAIFPARPEAAPRASRLDPRRGWTPDRVVDSRCEERAPARGRRVRARTLIEHAYHGRPPGRRHGSTIEQEDGLLAAHRDPRLRADSAPPSEPTAGSWPRQWTSCDALTERLQPRSRPRCGHNGTFSPPRG